MHNPTDKDDEYLFTFSLSSNRSKRSREYSLPSSPPPLTMQIPFMDAPAAPDSTRSRHAARRVRSESIPPPFPWATNRRGKVHSRKYLLENKIVAITGSVECRKCKNKFEMVLDLESKLEELLNFIRREEETMHDRAPKVWMLPVLPKCQDCGQENSVQPSIAGTKKKDINWLFLFLGQMLGCCTLKQLKYFLKHTNIHRTGAKDRVLYLAYIALCKQLVPDASVLHHDIYNNSHDFVVVQE